MTKAPESWQPPSALVCSVDTTRHLLLPAAAQRQATNDYISRVFLHARFFNFTEESTQPRIFSCQQHKNNTLMTASPKSGFIPPLYTSLNSGHSHTSSPASCIKNNTLMTASPESGFMPPLYTSLNSRHSHTSSPASCSRKTTHYSLDQKTGGPMCTLLQYGHSHPSSACCSTKITHD